MSVENNETQISRRTIAKGAAWTVPVITAGVAAPMAAASVAPPCPTCIAAGIGGAFTAQWIGLAGFGVVTGNETFNLDASGCNLSLFVPTYTMAGLGGSLIWSDGSSSVVGAAALGGGTLGQISLVNGTYTTADQAGLPNGTGLFGAYQNSQKHPAKICFNVRMYFNLLSLIPMPACDYQICYDICGLVTLGSVVLGSGTVNWSGTLCNGTVTAL